MPIIRVNSTAIQTVIDQHSLNPLQTLPRPHILWLSPLLSDSILHDFPGRFAVEYPRELLYSTDVRKRRFCALEGAVSSFGGDGEEGSGGKLGGEEEVVRVVVNDGGGVDGLNEGVHVGLSMGGMRAVSYGTLEGRSPIAIKYAKFAISRILLSRLARLCPAPMPVRVMRVLAM